MPYRDEPPTYRHPLLWVPSSFFAMGTIYTLVTTASNILFANLGVSNAHAAAYSSLTGLAYTLNPVWAPLVELYRTKKFFVVTVQVLLAFSLLCTGLALRSPSSVALLVALFLIAALAGSTQDLATNGVYVTTLDDKRQAAFTGVQSMTWSIGPVLAGSFLVLLVGRLAGEADGGRKPAAAAYAHGWSVVLFALAALMLVLAAWHRAILPDGARAKDAPRSFEDVAVTFGRVFVTFFRKPDISRLVGFAFFYRFGLGLLDKVAPLFILDARARGGLGLDNSRLGLLNGIATAAFILGSLTGGWFVARRGLRRSLLLLCLALNMPNVTFLYLGWARPESLWLIGAIFVVEKLGWGFGAVGHMLYMMQEIAPGPYQTAHYAFATGLGLNLCMTLTGLASGYIESAVGYQAFFVIVLIAATPSILFTTLAPFRHTEKMKAAFATGH